MRSAARSMAGNVLGQAMKQNEAELAELMGSNKNALRLYGEWFDLAWQRFSNACAYCQGLGRVTSATPYGHVLKTLDHFIPVSKGGTDARWNLIPACLHCNSAKGNRDALAWYRKQPFFSLERWARITNHIALVKSWDDNTQPVERPNVQTSKRL
jgi:hypothetical protein